MCIRDRSVAKGPPRNRGQGASCPLTAVRRLRFYWRRSPGKGISGPASDARPGERNSTFASCRDRGSADMIDEQISPRVVDSEMGPTRSGGRTFNQWLDVQVRARKLTQRQLAQKSGVDHSTISRLMRGDRTPSLRTVTLLARGLGLSQDPGWLDAQSLGRTDAPTARVEYALRSDGLPTEAAVVRIMNVYLAAR